MSKLDVDKHIDVEIKLDEFDLTSAESKATYAQIKEYVLEKFGLKVSTLYIAQIKKKCGIEMREHYNKSKKDNQAIPQCTPEKEEAIMDALRHFKMISFKLLIATGASSAIPPIKNLRDGNFVYSVRNIDDIYKIKEKAQNSKNVVIIGAGLVGIDALVGLFKYEQLNISVAFMEKYILDRQLDEYTASVYENKFKEKGVKFYPSASIQEIVLDNSKNVTGVAFSNGEVLDADMVIVATGVKPNADFLDGTGIEYDRGIIIDDMCQTTQKDIYAAGDVVGKNAIWPLAVKQGIVAAYNMVGKDKKIEDEFAFKNSMNFMDIPTISIGMNTPVDDSYKVLTRHGINDYKKFVFKDNVIYGAVIQGDISYVGVLTYLIKNKVEIYDLENRIFDICYADFFNIKENGEFCYSV